MAKYITEQKKMLLDFLYKNCENSYSTETLISELRALYGDGAPGKSTIYRLITNLLADGKVKRFVKGKGRGFVYQIVKDDDCRSHLHLRCTDCGKLFHLDEAVSDELLFCVKRSNNFSVSEEDTVLMGKCADCNNQRKLNG